MPSPAPSDSADEAAGGLLERGSQLSALNDQLAAVIGDGRGRVVFVAGEAGVGKTVLVRRFSRVHRDAVDFLSGACDALFTPRPLGPFHDMAASIGAGFEELIDSGVKPYRIASTLLDRLADRGVTVLIVEDAHWADEATLDVLLLLVRRIEAVPTLMVVTYRDDGLDRAHPLRVLLGGLSSAGSASRIRLPALSATAVARLAKPHGVDPLDLYEKTGGNPFFVTEVLAASDNRIPDTVRDAVLARAAHLSINARTVLEAASVLQPQAELRLLETLAPQTTDHLDECLASGMLRATPGATAFRHELARLAIEESLAPNARRSLHVAALAALSSPPSGAPDVARLAHHAEAAHDADAVLHHAPAAAASAAAAGAHREAAAQYERALRFAGDAGAATRGGLRDRHSYECYVTGHFDAAIESARSALDCHRESNDARSEGNTLSTLSRLLRYVGRPAEAAQAGRAAVTVLEGLDEPGHELAMAYCHLSYLFMSIEDLDGTLAWASKATALAKSLGDLEAEIYAEINIRSLEYLAGNADSVPRLERCLRRAADAGLDEYVGRAYVTLVFWAPRSKAHDAAGRYMEDGLQYCAEHGLDIWRSYLMVSRARSHLDHGHWDQAVESASMIIQDPCTSPVTRVIALAVIGLVRARRGDPECWPPLDEAWRLAEPTGELQRIELVALARAEAAWLEGNPRLVASATEAALALAEQRRAPWIAAGLATWRWRAGLDERFPRDAPPPFAAQVAGDWERAAELWQRLGCPYEAALSLADADDEGALRHALVDLQRLGARPAAGLVARNLRGRGARSFPRGPRPSTLRHAAGLTNREREVLARIAEGLQDREIAELLFVSQRTVGHHVSAILRKLGVSSRKQAAREAARAGLIGEGPASVGERRPS
ncbi:MAG TPA: AAA family ATPase [Candidatus Dormibacteraeota bacterium]|nr:AAA family ATPase [Candidatus Dormibacteraeota bacterium]